MSVGWRFPWRKTFRSFTVVIGLGMVLHASSGQSETCVLPPHHAGVTFPVEKVDPHWACRLEAIVGNYTTAGKVGPIRTSLSESLYRYLLDRPPLAAALINRLDLGLYKSEARGPGRFWGHDGEGTEGIVQLVYQDHTSRIYYLEGTHDSRLLPHISGKAVVFLRMNQVSDANGMEAMDSTMVSYTKLDNRILSGLAFLLRPLIEATVTRKLRKGVQTVNRLGQMMRQHSDRVLFEAMDPPAVPDDDVAFLKEALGSLKNPGKASHQKTLSP
ncbi:MAG: hypothetical protein ACT4OL_13095 [Nitrospiraceae bacterium]